MSDVALQALLADLDRRLDGAAEAAFVRARLQEARAWLSDGAFEHNRAAETLLHDKIAALTELQGERARADALARELKAARAAIRDRDAQLQIVRSSLLWNASRPGRAVMRLIRGEASLRGTVLLGTRLVYRALPLSDRVRRRIRERILHGLRLYRAYRSRGKVQAAPPPVPAPRERQPLAFPLPGMIAALPEIAGTRPETLDLTVSVVIPTYNAGAEFYWLLRKLRAQRGLGSVEIVVVDSGSSDGTVEQARKAGCRVVQIDKSQFSHSYARNLGAQHASGDLLLFTVQDAYPIGDYWLHTLARCLRNPDAQTQLAAVSCAEFPRTDSELLYNALIDTHYRFLGCRDRDRVGAFTGESNEALRSQGQLSDVACMIERSTFERYFYHGRYAEDLTLGVRLIRDGQRIGMLSSVKVIHSHNRPKGYYVRRIFVDVAFLTDVFPDFQVPDSVSIIGTFAAAYTLQDHLRRFRWPAGGSAGQRLDSLIGSLDRVAPPALVPDLVGQGDFGHPPLGEWISNLARDASREGTPLTAAELRDAERMRSMLIDRLSHLRDYVTAVDPALDARVSDEIEQAVEKTLSMTLGAQLAFIHLNTEAGLVTEHRAAIAHLKPMLLAGI
ncbi:MAG TPA: glycosyltransferase [Microvirga sp.]|jgi:glycosyltransferase involved in cell wall biosynthesis